jgi:hypothetical protein
MTVLVQLAFIFATAVGLLVLLGAAWGGWRWTRTQLRDGWREATERARRWLRAHQPAPPHPPPATGRRRSPMAPTGDTHTGHPGDTPTEPLRRGSRR